MDVSTSVCTGITWRRFEAAYTEVEGVGNTQNDKRETERERRQRMLKRQHGIVTTSASGLLVRVRAGAGNFWQMGAAGEDRRNVGNNVTL